MYTAGWASSSSTLTAGRTVTAMLVDAVVLEPASIRRLNATAGHELLVRYMLPNGEIMEKMVPAANLQPTLQRTRRAMAASRLGDESEPPSRSKRRAASSPSAQHSQERSLSKRTHARRILIHSLFTSRSDRWSVGHEQRSTCRSCCQCTSRPFESHIPVSELGDAFPNFFCCSPVARRFAPDSRRRCGRSASVDAGTKPRHGRPHMYMQCPFKSQGRAVFLLHDFF